MSNLNKFIMKIIEALVFLALFVSHLPISQSIVVLKSICHLGCISIAMSCFGLGTLCSGTIALPPALPLFTVCKLLFEKCLNACSNLLYQSNQLDEPKRPRQVPFDLIPICAKEWFQRYFVFNFLLFIFISKIKIKFKGKIE